MRTMICQDCGNICVRGSNVQKRCAPCGKKHIRITSSKSNVKYYRSSKGKAARRKYDLSPKGKANWKKYINSPKGKAKLIARRSLVDKELMNLYDQVRKQKESVESLQVSMVGGGL